MSEVKSRKTLRNPETGAPKPERALCGSRSIPMPVPLPEQVPQPVKFTFAAASQECCPSSACFTQFFSVLLPEKSQQTGMSRCGQRRVERTYSGSCCESRGSVSSIALLHDVRQATADRERAIQDRVPGLLVELMLH